jgi:hypothetical protein
MYREYSCYFLTDIKFKYSKSKSNFPDVKCLQFCTQRLRYFKTLPHGKINHDFLRASRDTKMVS